MKPNLRIITKKFANKSRARRSSKSCENYEKMMKTLLLQNQQIIIQQQNMMFMVMRQFHGQQQIATPNEQSANLVNLAHSSQAHEAEPAANHHQHMQQQQQQQQELFQHSANIQQVSSQQQVLQPLHTQAQLVQTHPDLIQTSQQSTVASSRAMAASTTTITTMAGHHQQQLGSLAGDSQQQHNHHQHHHHHHHHDDGSAMQQSHHHQQHVDQSQNQLTFTSSQSEQHQSQQHVSQAATPAHMHSDSIAAAYLTPVASEQDPVSDSKPDDDDISALLSGDDLLTSNLLYNPQTDIGQITPYKSQPHQETPSYYSSGAESLTTPRVEQPRQQTTANINQNVVKNLADSFKSPSKPKINVQILSGSATRNMKNNKAKIIQRMNISEFLRHVHQDDQAAQQQQPLKSSATQ